MCLHVCVTLQSVREREKYREKDREMQERGKQRERVSETVWEGDEVIIDLLLCLNKEAFISVLFSQFRNVPSSC